jgi:cardiolipin synthase
MKAKYIPNILTLFRIFMILPFLYFLYQEKYKAAFYVFFVAGLTDGFDGWLARRFNWKTAFGSFIDPLADKLLVSASFISLALMGILPWWLMILVSLRDLTISIGVVTWLRVIRHRIVFEPTLLSKLNTLLQILLICLCLFELAFFVPTPSLKPSLMTLTALTTLASYIDYVWTWSKKAYETGQHD